jgi:DNA-binding winged helix-turn-helix (wHTH) protein
MKVTFGEFVFDSKRHQLSRGDEAVHLTPKAFRLLEILIERRPDAVSKRDLHELVWPDTFVEIANLDGLVAEIRRALGEGRRRSRYIQTIYGFGFAFRSKDEETTREPAKFRITQGSRSTPLQDGDNILGRDDEAAVLIDSPSISRRHAKIVITVDRAVLEDLGSKNGTFISDHRITAPTELRDGDEIRLGGIRMRFRAGSRLQTTRTTRS